MVPYIHKIKDDFKNLFGGKRLMNTSLENLTHKMQRAAVGKMVDVVLSHADKDPEKTMGQIVDLAKQFYGSSFSDETYERAKKTLSDPDSKWSLRYGRP